MRRHTPTQPRTAPPMRQRPTRAWQGVLPPCPPPPLPVLMPLTRGGLGERLAPLILAPALINLNAINVPSVLLKITNYDIMMSCATWQTQLHYTDNLSPATNVTHIINKMYEDYAISPRAVERSFQHNTRKDKTRRWYLQSLFILFAATSNKVLSFPDVWYCYSCELTFGL